MLACQITDLARSWIHRVAWWNLTTDVRVLVGFCASAVAVGWDGLVVDVVHYEKRVSMCSVLTNPLQLSRMRDRGANWQNLQNGPRLASGSPESETWKFTPVPLELLVPTTEPRMLVVARSGSVAT